MIKFNFYATLLDAFQNYLDAESTYNKFYAESDKFSSFEEYDAQCKQEFIDRLNRVGFSSEAADKGTAFNEAVDFVNTNKLREDMTIDTIEYNGCQLILVKFNDYEFTFDKQLVMDMANKYKDAIPQLRCEKILPTKYGDVNLYGYIDELMPDSIIDIKTTGNYKAFKFRDHWQHIVYPYCIDSVTMFEYDIVLWKKNGGYERYNEVYNFNPDTDIPKLTQHCEALIEFLQANRELITDKKLFNILN